MRRTRNESDLSYSRELLDEATEDGIDFSLNDSPKKSFLTSSTTFNSTATSSKAVLAALRALQDKIRRLESEKLHAIDETDQLKHQLSLFESETEKTRQLEISESKKKLEDAKYSHDKLLFEKKELESRIEKMDEKSRQSMENLEEVMKQLRRIEQEKASCDNRLKDMDKETRSLEARLEAVQKREKEINAMMERNKRKHVEEVHQLEANVTELKSQLSAATAQRVETETRLYELDDLVGRLLAVNESLVAYLSGKKVSSGQEGPIKMEKQPLKSRPSSAGPERLSSAPSSRAATSKVKPPIGYSGKRESKDRPAKGEPTVSSKQSIRTVIPVVASGSTEADQFRKLRDMCASLAVTAKILSDRSKTADITSSRMRTRISRDRSPVAVRTSDSSGKSSGDSDRRVSSGRMDSRADYTPEFGSEERNEYTRPSSPFPRPSPKFTQYPQHLSPSSPTLRQLEADFESLNDRYNELIETVQSDGDPKVQSKYAEELVSIIKQLHRKGEQLRDLKSSLNQSTW